MLKILNNVTIKLIESLKRKNSSTLRINAFRMKRYIWNKTSSFCPIPCHLWGLLYRATELIGPSPPRLTLYCKTMCCHCCFFLRSWPPARGSGAVEWTALWASSLLPSLLLSVSEVSPPVSHLWMPPPQPPWPCYFFSFNSFTICWVYRKGEDKGKMNLPSF